MVRKNQLTAEVLTSPFVLSELVCKLGCALTSLTLEMFDEDQSSSQYQMALQLHLQLSAFIVKKQSTVPCCILIAIRELLKFYERDITVTLKKLPPMKEAS